MHAVGAEERRQQLDRRRQDEHLREERDDHRQRQQAAEPRRRLVLGEREHAERELLIIAVVSAARPFVLGRERDRLVGRRAGRGLAPVPADEMNRVVVDDAERDARQHDGGDVQRDAEPAHDAEDREHRETGSGRSRATRTATTGRR